MSLMIMTLHVCNVITTNEIGVTSGTPVNGILPCYFTSSTYYSGPFALYAYAAYAPSVISIVAKPSTMTIIITFDQSTNTPFGGICSSIFDASTISLLGSDAICSWTSSSILSVTHFNVTMRVGRPLTIIGMCYTIHSVT